MIMGLFSGRRDRRRAALLATLLQERRHLALRALAAPDPNVVPLISVDTFRSLRRDGYARDGYARDGGRGGYLITASGRAALTRWDAAR